MPATGGLTADTATGDDIMKLASKISLGVTIAPALMLTLATLVLVKGIDVRRAQERALTQALGRLAAIERVKMAGGTLSDDANTFVIAAVAGNAGEAARIKAGFAAHGLELGNSLRDFHSAFDPDSEQEHILTDRLASASLVIGSDARAIFTPGGTGDGRSMSRKVEKLRSDTERDFFPIAEQLTDIENSRAQADFTAARKTLRLFTYGVFAFSTLVFLGFAAFAVVIVRAFARPVHQLEKAALAIGAGDLDARAEVASKDELGTLAETFNFMAEALKERTGKLTRSNLELQEALANVKTLSGLLPICANCKKIRDDKGYWQMVETYFDTHSALKFTHGFCPDCLRTLYPEFHSEMEKKAAGQNKEKN